WLGYKAVWPQVGEGNLVVIEQRGAVGERDRGEVQGLRTEGVHQVDDAGPHEQVDDPIGEKVLHRAMRPGIDAGERVRERTCGTPRHGENHVQRNMQRLCAVNVTVAWWVGDNDVGPEGLRPGPFGVGLDTGPPRGREDLGDPRSLLRHILPELIETCRNDAATRLDHVLHELVGIARERIEFQPGTLDHGPELAMRSDAHAVPLRQPATDRNYGLEVPAR